jgi:hypothetical protein
MKSIRTISTTLITLSCMMASAVNADTITLTNGDHLSGTLLNISSGLVSFRTKLAGRIMVPENQVTSLNTEGFLVIALNNETALPGRIATDDSSFTVIAPDGQTKTPIKLSQVNNVETMPTPAKSETPNLEISVATGYQLRTGTKDAAGPTASLTIEQMSESIATHFNAKGEYTEDADDLDRYFEGELSVAGTQNPKANPALILEVERNRDKALDLGLEAAVGVTGNLHQGAGTLSGFAGVGGRSQRFDPDPLRGDLGSRNDLPATLDDQDEDDLHADVRLRYTRDILQRSTITEQMTLKPSLGDPGDIRAELESSLSVPLTLNLSLDFDLLFDYTSDTAYHEVDKWNSSVSAGLRITF